MKKNKITEKNIRNRNNRRQEQKGGGDGETFPSCACNMRHKSPAPAILRFSPTPPPHLFPKK